MIQSGQRLENRPGTPRGQAAVRQDLNQNEFGNQELRKIIPGSPSSWCPRFQIQEPAKARAMRRYYGARNIAPVSDELNHFGDTAASRRGKARFCVVLDCIHLGASVAHFTIGRLAFFSSPYSDLT